MNEGDEEINEAQAEELDGRQEQMMRNQSKILIALEGLRAAYWHLLNAYHNVNEYGRLLDLDLELQNPTDEPRMLDIKGLIIELDSEIKNIKKLMEVI